MPRTLLNIFDASRRKRLRNESTVHEQKVWNRLKDSQLGYKFRRQHGIGPYIVDFYCPEKKLIIEIDGLQHLYQKEYDQNRTIYFEMLGRTVLRFWNSEVNESIEGVLMTITAVLQSTHHPSIPSSTEEGRTCGDV